MQRASERELERRECEEKGKESKGKESEAKGAPDEGEARGGRGRGVNNFSIIKIIVIIGRYVLKIEGREGRERGNFVVFQNIKKRTPNTR